MSYLKYDCNFYIILYYIHIYHIFLSFETSKWAELHKMTPNMFHFIQNMIGISILFDIVKLIYINS